MVYIFLFGTFSNWVPKSQPKIRLHRSGGSSSYRSTQRPPSVQLSSPLASRCSPGPWLAGDFPPRSCFCSHFQTARNGRSAHHHRCCVDPARQSQVSIFSLVLRAAQCPIIHSCLTCYPVSCLPCLSKPHHSGCATTPKVATRTPLFPPQEAATAGTCLAFTSTFSGPSPLLPAAFQGQFLHPSRLSHDHAAPEFPLRPPPPPSPPGGPPPRETSQASL